MAIEELDFPEFSKKRGGRLPGGKAAFRLVGIELGAIEAEQGGIPAESILERARTSGTALNTWDQQYGYFEWDDTVAAEEYRLEQARSLIRTVTVVSQVGDQRLSTRGFYAVTDEAHGKVYRSVGFVAADPDAHNEIIARFENEIVRLTGAYQAYLAYADFAVRGAAIFNEMDRFIDEMAAEGDVRARELQRQRFRRDAQNNLVLTT